MIGSRLIGGGETGLPSPVPTRFVGFKPEYEVYSETGETFGVRSLDPEPTRTLARSLLSVVYNPLRWYRIEYFPKGNYDLETLKQKIRRFVAHDQDVLTQFLDANEINLHLDRAGSFEKVVEVVRGIEGACEAGA